MRRLRFFLWVFAFLGVVGCGNKQEAGEQGSAASDKAVASQLPPSDVTSTPGEEAAPAPMPEPPVEGLYISPYFDEAGTKTELAVAPGQSFKIYVFAETIDPYSTASAAYRLEVPEGVQVSGIDEAPIKMMSMGDYKESYSLAYHCQPPGRFRVVTYICMAQPDFQGGTVAVRGGIMRGISFLGFSTCDFVELTATGGSATLARK